jgi:hypothetical protein
MCLVIPLLSYFFYLSILPLSVCSVNFIYRLKHILRLLDQFLHQAERHNCSSEGDKFDFRLRSMADPTIALAESHEYPNIPHRS